MLKNKINQLLLVALTSIYGISAYALPSLQPGCEGTVTSQSSCNDDSATISILGGDSFDPFTVKGEQHLAHGIVMIDVVNAVTPYSNEAETGDGVPEPGIPALLGIGLAVIGFTLRMRP